MRVINVGSEVFEFDHRLWALFAQSHVDGLSPGSIEETDLIHMGFLELTGFEQETVEEIRKQLSI